MGMLYAIILVLAVSARTQTASADVCSGHSNGEQIPNPDDCGSYYVCDYGRASLFKCGASLLYDSALRVCNWPHEVECGREPNLAAEPVIEQPPPPTTPLQKPPANPSSVNPHPSWPTKSPLDHSIQIPPTTNHDNEQHNLPDDYYPGIQINPNVPTGYQCTLDGFYFVPHPTVCERYFICADRHIHFHQCGSGIHWDYVYVQCNFPQRSYCYANATQMPTYVPISGGTSDELTWPPVEDGTLLEDSSQRPGWPEIESPAPEIQPPVRRTTTPTPTTTKAPTRPPTTSTRMPTTTTTTRPRPTTTLAPWTSTTTTTTTPPSRAPITAPYHESVEDDRIKELSCPPSIPFMAHDDCHMYYICIARLPVAISCPEKMAWNKSQMQCTEESLRACDLQHRF